MNLPLLPRCLFLEPLLDQQRDHGLDHLGTAAQKYMRILRAWAAAPSLPDRVALPQVLNVPDSALPRNRFFVGTTDDGKVRKIGPKALHAHED